MVDQIKASAKIEALKIKLNALIDETMTIDVPEQMTDSVGFMCDTLADAMNSMGTMIQMCKVYEEANEHLRA